MESQNRSQFLTLPGAIIIAGAIIALAIIYVKQPAKQAVTNEIKPPTVENQANIRPVAKNDHIYGNPNAPIKIVEYSDTSCPFCKQFNPIMEQVMEQYGPTGQVAWVYRHFPLDKPDADGNILHKNSGHEAQALECAASLGGNDKFWAYEKKIYEITPSVTAKTPEGLDQTMLPQIAKMVGIDTVAFNECLSSGQFKDKVEADYVDGVNAGINGTPYSIIVTPSGSKIHVEGLKGTAYFKSAIDALLSDLKP